jgi:hypothetical protein
MKSSFNTKAFMKAELEARTEVVPVPDLKEFFDAGADPVWIVRGISGHELGKVQEEKDRAQNVEAILEVIVSERAKDKAEAVKRLLGVDGSTPADIVRRIEMLKLGSVDPAVDHELSVRMCTFFPAEFMDLTNKIIRLTGQGASVKKKPTPSGAAPTSETP